MKKWTAVDQALTPDGKTISLHEHDGSYMIRVDGVPLMSTRQHASEEKLAELACAHVRGIRGARVLIGGLGFGFTLRAALAALGARGQGGGGRDSGRGDRLESERSLPLAADALSDPRVTVLQQDVGEAIGERRGRFDAIILDVDNGPAALSTDSNRSLYNSTGLRNASAALRTGGCLALWSVAPDLAFESLMTQAGFRVEVQRCRSHGNSGRWHTLFLGRVK